MKRIILLFLSFVFVLLVHQSCQVVKDVSNTLANIKRLEFQLGNVNNYTLSGVNLSSKRKLEDFSVADALRLTDAYRKKSLPSQFTLNVKARNPNDGTNQTKKTSATIENMQWKLYVDDVETISGNLANSVTVPGTGEEAIIPLNVSLDLYQFFNDKSYDNLLNLALTIAGNKGTNSNLRLEIKPTVSTPIGPISYPGWLNVVDKNWSN